MERGDVLLPRRRRAGNPKARTGCFTCKARKVKCDEGKPDCARCERLGLTCGGYLVPRTKWPYFSGKVPILKKQTAPENKSDLNVSIPDLKLALMRPTGIFPGQTEAEHQYLSHFSEDLAVRFSGHYGDPLWPRLMRQASHNYEFARYGLAALGALNKSVEYSSTTTSNSPTSSESSLVSNSERMAAFHKEYAFKSYQKAIQLMMRTPPDPNPSHALRRALISSLLIVSFEKFLGNDRLVVKTLITAQALLASFFQSNPLPEHTRGGESSGTGNPFAAASPLPETVEDELVKTFKRLDVQVMLFQDDRPSDLHAFGTKVDAQLTKEMPVAFADLNEARDCLDILVARYCHFVIGACQDPEAEPLHRPSTIPGTQDLSQWETFSTLYAYGSPVLHTKAAIDQSKIHLAELRSWISAIDELMRNMGTNINTTGSARFQSFRLRLNALFWSIVLESMKFTTECEYDTVFPVFQEIHNSSMKLMGGDKGNVTGALKSMNAQGYLIDLGGALPVFYMGTKVRDRGMREQVSGISDWMGKNWRGGVMAKPMLVNLLADVLRWMRGIEEEGLGKDDYIPEKKRVTITRLAKHKEGDLVLLQCVQKSGGVDGGPVYFDKVIEVEVPGTS